MLRKSPGFTAAAVVILAIGIGANGAIFTLINAVLLRPVIGTGVEGRFVGLYSGDRVRPDTFRPFSYPEYLDLRDRNEVFTGVIAEAGVRTGITESGQMRRVSTTLVSSNYFAALDVPMMAGRDFTAGEEHTLSDAAVLVISPGIARRYGGVQEAIGRRLLLNGREFTVVGVVPEWFRGTMAVMTSELWAPFGAARLLVPADQRGYIVPASLDRSTPALLLAGTLKPGVSVPEAQALLRPLADALAATYPEFNRNQQLIVQPRSRTARGAGPRSDGAALGGATVLMAIAGMVLVVACLNLANMLLARGNARRQEIAVRLALGGGQLRIVRQLVIEGLLLSALGGAAALAMSWWAAQIFVTSLIGFWPVPIFLDVSPDARVIAIIAGAVIVGTLIFSLGPAWRLSRPELATALKPSTQMMTTRAGRFSAASGLVAAQITLSVALMVTAAVCIRASMRAASSDPGFALAGGLIAEIDGALAGADAMRARNQYGAALARVRALDGVRSASLASIVPFGDGSAGRLVRVDDDDVPVFATTTVIGSSYFSTLGLPIAAGRDFRLVEESTTTAPVAIVDRLFAERLFGGGNPLGRVVHFVDPEGGVDDSLQIVGVVPTVRDDILESPRPHVYVPFGRTYRVGMTLHASVAPGAEARMIEPVMQAIQAEAQPLPIVSVRTLIEHRDRSPSLWVLRFAARLFVAFGVIALVLATAGVYGLRAYLVARRTREIGIRLALGATNGRVVDQLLREGTAIAAAGLAAGLLLAAGLVQLLQSGIVMDVGARDPIAFGAASAMSALATIAASYIPVRRALRIDPAVALRPE
jgi:predicted permease